MDKMEFGGLLVAILIKENMTRSIILQSTTTEQQSLLNLSTPINQKYATQFNFEYIADTTNRITDGRDACWSKIACLNAILPTIDDGSLIVYMDADSLCIGTDDMHTILPSGGVLGMVPLRTGGNGQKIRYWYNSGVIALINGPGVRNFLTAVWNLNGLTDEHGLNRELNNTDFVISDGQVITSLDVKWNCWQNNLHLCTSPAIRSFHGIKGNDKKLAAMTAFLNPPATASSS